MNIYSKKMIINYINILQFNFGYNSEYFSSVTPAGTCLANKVGVNLQKS